ncbi:hypothetical protein ACNJ7E_02635 [Rhodococcus sp. NM-2]|uniref:hypothetical protein n=1 Tax=Rhodococcus sp. NM-2 TaxID=3401174 RepID=UPI003AAD70ED
MAHVPTHGSFALDPNTHRFLLNASSEGGARVDLDECSPDTVESIQKLHSAGIVTTDHDGVNQTAHAEYIPALTDLVVRRRSVAFEAVVAAIGGAISRVAIPLIIYAAVALLIALAVFWTFIEAPSELVIGIFANHPFTFIALVVAVGTVRVVLHEAGHYGVAHRHGVQPTVGLGVYFTGPVAYVNLSPLDTHRRSIRLSADVGGLAVDGILLATATGLWCLTGSPLFSVVSVLLSALALTSFSPLEKSDAYWFVRDLFDARAVSASWDRPLTLLREVRNPTVQGNFARILLFVYGLSLVVGIAAVVRWAPGVIDAVENRNTSLLFPVGASLMFVTLTGICILVVRKRHRLQA